MCKQINIKSSFYMSILNTNETTTIKGANLKAEDTLAINSKNLNIESVQNRQKSRDKSNGFSVGFGASGLQSLGMSKSSGSLDSKETLLTDLRGNSVNITTQEQTKLRGATIAAVDSQGNDNSQLALNTDTLLASSLNNRVDSKNKSLSINIGGNVEENTLNNVALDYSNDTSNQKTKTLATIGTGTINITNTDDSELKMLNRDIQDSEVDIYNIQSHKGLKTEIDTRMLTSEGREEIKQEYKDMDKNMNAIAKTLPDSKSDHPVEAMAGAVLDVLATVTGGILPTTENHGGLLANIPIITGNNDSNFKVTGDLSSTRVYLNGQSNTLLEAIQGGNNIIGDIPHQNWYNPTQGFIGDTLESATDLLFNNLGMQTGISKQIGVLQNNGTVWKIYMHSQGNLIAKEGTNKNNTYYSYGSPLFNSTVEEVFDTKPNKNKGDFVANPQNIFLPSTWFEAGHSTENYGAAKENKERLLKEKIEQ